MNCKTQTKNNIVMAQNTNYLKNIFERQVDNYFDIICKQNKRSVVHFCKPRLRFDYCKRKYQKELRLTSISVFLYNGSCLCEEGSIHLL